MLLPSSSEMSAGSKVFVSPFKYYRFTWDQGVGVMPFYFRGQNIKLASRLLDLEIDVFRELDETQEEDVDIEEFSDEIEGWIIDELKRIGLDTAKSVLNLDKEDLIKRADLEESTIDEVISTLKKEFE